MQKIYDPQLIWAYLKRWAEQSQGFVMGNRISLFIYLKKGDPGGAFYLHGPKLYWDDNPTDGYFSNCDQDRLQLEAEAGNLGEVIVYGVNRENRDPVLFPTFGGFLGKIGMKPIPTDEAR